MDYLINHPEIERKSITIYGQSLGGHLSILVANKYQNKIDGVVAEGAFSSHSSVAGNRVPILGNIFVRELYSAKKTIPIINFINYPNWIFNRFIMGWCWIRSRYVYRWLYGIYFIIEIVTLGCSSIV